MHHSTYRTAHTTAFVTPVVEDWLHHICSIKYPLLFVSIYISPVMHFRPTAAELFFATFESSFDALVRHDGMGWCWWRGEGGGGGAMAGSFPPYKSY